jgi:hypothetical protein
LTQIGITGLKINNLASQALSSISLWSLFFAQSGHTGLFRQKIGFTGKSVANERETAEMPFESGK